MTRKIRGNWVLGINWKRIRIMIDERDRDSNADLTI